MVSPTLYHLNGLYLILFHSFHRVLKPCHLLQTTERYYIFCLLLSFYQQNKIKTYYLFIGNQKTEGDSNEKTMIIMSILVLVSLLVTVGIIGKAFILNKSAKFYLLIFFAVGTGLGLLRFFVNSSIKK